MSDRPALLRVEVPKGVDPDVVSGALWSHGPASILEGDGWLEAGFASRAAAARVAATLKWRSVIELVEDDSWGDAWRAHAEPVRVGSLLVVPSWFDVIAIDPGSSFGSGSHPSTRLCLAALEDLAQDARVLDVGCGSGILAIAAMRLGAREAIAIDVASEAIEATRENAARNGVDVDVRHATVEDIDGTFDVVVANIGSATLRSMAPALVGRVGGTLVLAGLLDDQVPEVVAAFSALALEAITSDEGWSAVRFRR